ncbi:hypothetical protein OG21DRAFT_1514285 [Imleria badia]|nr:hypothetical protein OG21DRAFT_1514285 [Imleria badia]
MAVEDRQELPFPGNDGRNLSNDASQIRPYPVISKSDSLEDGEIVEGRFSSISSQPLPQQHQDPPQLPNLVRTSTPVFPAAELAVSLPPKVEPMTTEDLDRAKSLVLDLLGWGVTPEYLVECGLSAGAIYKIFTDLQLRLPSNLESVVSTPAPS